MIEIYKDLYTTHKHIYFNVLKNNLNIKFTYTFQENLIN